MDENEFIELFKATNTAEPLSEGWPGLLRFGLAVAAAEREACAKLVEERYDLKIATTYDWTKQVGQDIAAAIRERSNV